jgi:predicted nucleotidyltransferase
MLTRDIAINTAQKFIAEIIKLGYNPQQAILFGSVVNGKVHEYSDIDLALWDSKFTGIMHEDVAALKVLFRNYKQVELHPFNANTTDETNPFISIIKATGIHLPLEHLSAINEPTEKYGSDDTNK